jgi:hypothetical protein
LALHHTPAIGTKSSGDGQRKSEASASRTKERKGTVRTNKKRRREKS